jgi:hypothetical protein
MYEYEIGREFCNCGSLMKCETDFRNRVDYGESGAYCIEIYSLYECPACNEVTIICFSSPGDENLDETHQGNPEWELYRRYYRSVLHAPFKQLHSAVPNAIADIVNQAQAVLFKSPRASFILCRAALEEICDEFDIPKKKPNKKGGENFVNLKSRLSQLFDREKMPNDLADIIEGIRELGNEGAHSTHLDFSRKIRPQDVETLLGLVDYVIDRLYVDRHRREEAEEKLNRLRENAGLNPNKSEE